MVNLVSYENLWNRFHFAVFTVSVVNYRCLIWSTTNSRIQIVHIDLIKTCGNWCREYGILPQFNDE